MITFGLGLHKYSARARAGVYNFYFPRMRHETWRDIEGLFRGSQSDQPGGRDKIGTGSMIGKFARQTFTTGSNYKAASQ